MNHLDRIFGLQNVISKEIKSHRGRCLMQWPAHSPDLNPLDFCLWALMKKVGLQLTDKGFYKSRVELKTLIKEAWDDIDQRHVYNACVRGVKHRIMKCIAVEGASTKNFRRSLHTGNLPYDRHRDNDLNSFD